jgi:hypothetical protein
VLFLDSRNKYATKIPFLRVFMNQVGKDRKNRIALRYELNISVLHSQYLLSFPIATFRFFQ